MIYVSIFGGQALCHRYTVSSEPSTMTGTQQVGGREIRELRFKFRAQQMSADQVAWLSE